MYAEQSLGSATKTDSMGASYPPLPLLLQESSSFAQRDSFQLVGVSGVVLGVVALEEKEVAVTAPQSVLKYIC